MYYSKEWWDIKGKKQNSWLFNMLFFYLSTGLYFNKIDKNVCNWQSEGNCKKNKKSVNFFL